MGNLPRMANYPHWAHVPYSPHHEREERGNMAAREFSRDEILDALPALTGYERTLVDTWHVARNGESAEIESGDLVVHFKQDSGIKPRTMIIKADAVKAELER